MWFVAEARAEDVPRDLPGEVMPRRAWDVVATHLEVALDPRSDRVQGTVTHTVTPLGGADPYVRLHAHALSIDAVTVDGAAVTGWRLGEDALDVPVADPAREHTIAVTWHAAPDLGLQFRRPPHDATVELWSQGEDADNRYWYPAWDYPNDRFRYSADLTVPTGFVALTNGVETSRTDLGDGRVRWSYALDGTIPNYLVTVAVGDYAVYLDEGPVPLEYVAPKRLPEDDVRRTFALVKGPMGWFGDRFGRPYPWPNNRQVLVQRFLYVAMENPGVTTFDQDVLLFDGVDRGTWTEDVVAHELAHHWFGDWVTCYGWRELWLNEGFAEYWAGRWLAESRGPYAFADEARGWREGALRDPYPLAPTAWTKDGPRENGSVYDRGAMVLHLLSTYLGDDVFQRATREYVARHGEGFAETADFRRAVEDASGEHLGWLFDAYVSGSGAPAIDVSTTWADGQQTIVLRQSGDVAFHVPVEVEVGGDEVRTRRVVVGPGETKLVVDAASPAAWVFADPSCAVLADWTHDQPAAAWIAQLKGSPSPCARLEALDALGDAHPNEDALAALVAAATDVGSDVVVRETAARALGGHGSAARDALVGLVGAPEVRVRVAAYEALGDAKLAEPLTDALARESDPWGRGEALDALGRADPVGALPLARKSLADAKKERWERGAAAAILGRKGDANDVDRLARALAPGEPKHVRDRAGDALADLVTRLDTDATRAKAARAVEPSLDDPFLWARYAAASWLGRIGDEGSLAPLTDAAATCTVPSLCDAMRDAMAAIRAERRPDAPAEGPDLEQLEQRLDALETRMERFETWR